MLLLEPTDAFEMAGSVVYSDVALIVTRQQFASQSIVLHLVYAIIVGLICSADNILNEDVLLAQVELVHASIGPHIDRGLHVRGWVGKLLGQAGVADQLN